MPSSLLEPNASGPLYSAEQIKIPAELPDIIKEYSKYIIKLNPSDIYAASEEYSPCAFDNAVTSEPDLARRFFRNLNRQKRDGKTTAPQLAKGQLEVLYNKVAIARSTRFDITLTAKTVL